jgi:hypothetical protein
MVKPIGYFKIWRELLTKPIWLNSTPEQKTILITLLAMASFRPNQWEWKGEKFTVKPGQFVTSANVIINNCGQGVTRQNVRTALKRFEKYEFLTYESTNRGMLVTINNWELYQGSDDEPNQQPNQHLTSSQPAPNQQLTTIEEGKNDNKDIYNNIYNIHSAKSDDKKSKPSKKSIKVTSDQCDQLWKLYPLKKGKQQAMKKIPKLIEKYGEDQIKRAVQRYIEYVEMRRETDFPDLKYKDGSTFFNGGYADYLDDNYVPYEPEEHKKQPSGRVVADF